MDVLRGFRRLAIAVVGLWVATWATIGGYAAWQQGSWSELYIEASRANRTADLVFASQRSSHFGDLVSWAVSWGLLAIPMAIVFAATLWVLRGVIKPKS